MSVWNDVEHSHTICASINGGHVKENTPAPSAYTCTHIMQHVRSPRTQKLHEISSSNVSPLFYLNIIFNHNPLYTLIYLAHRGLSLKIFHHGKNWSLVFAAIQKESLPFPDHCGMLKNDGTTLDGHLTQ